jgi:Fe-S oxidoreductase
MVTREERHSTRGRAHLLFEMMQGDPMRDGWRDEHVKEALDLCLACKGCRSDCPMNVDMATYKAEFLAHYYEHRLRPRHAYAMGLVMVWARLASLAPGIANFLSHAPGLAALAKAAGGIAQAREVPRFAPYTFRAWFRGRRRRNEGGPPVVLFVDTFNDHFHPGTAIATLEALEEAGYAVELPARRLCCGRPLYDFGMLHRARRQLAEILDVLAPRVEAGVPVVGIEPSCVAVLRDELLGLFPDDPRARKLASATLMLSELMVRAPERFHLPRLVRKAVFQGHCHHHAVMGLEDELAVLARIGLAVERPDTGCCGMAGSFGFEAGTPHEVSIAAGERGILPAVRAAPKEALVLADGFSCREQIAQGTDRRGLHLAEVLKLAREGGASEAYPERRLAGWLPPVPRRIQSARRTAALVLAAGTLAIVAWTASRRRRVR